MNNEELIKENLLLREENEKLKKQLENYNIFALSKSMIEPVFS